MRHACEITSCPCEGEEMTGQDPKKIGRVRMQWSGRPRRSEELLPSESLDFLRHGSGVRKRWRAWLAEVDWQGLVKRSRALLGSNPARNSQADGAPKARGPVEVCRGPFMFPPRRITCRGC